MNAPFLRRNTLDLYIGRLVANNTLFVLAVLVGVFLLFNFIDQLGDQGIGNYGLPQILSYLLLTVPTLTYEVFPLSILIGTIVALSMLVDTSELVVMRASGASLMRIYRACAKVTILIAIVVFIMGEMLAPEAERRAQQLRASAMQTNVDVGARTGLWIRDGDTFINIREVLPDLSLVNVRLFEFDQETRLRSMVRSERGEIDGEIGKVYDVTQTKLFDDTVEVNNLDFALWRTDVTTRILKAFSLKPSQLSISGLNTYISHLRHNAQDTSVFELAYWSKVFFPITTLIMLYVAVPFVYSQTARGGNVGRNVGWGILFGIIFFVISRSFGYLVLVWNIPPVIGAIIPSVFFLMCGWLLARRAGG